ncbi:unnamed protein product [Coffea canephora]|uniref:Uncharacterized protein n=1 Tax=Coffea canephora TaxID=49390 RepID=A0A068UWX2_COFCA|nr:unnamed protein product [Coffea canephora]
MNEISESETPFPHGKGNLHDIHLFSTWYIVDPDYFFKYEQSIPPLILDGHKAIE